MWRILIRLSREFYKSDIKIMTKPSRRNSTGPNKLVIKALVGSHLELGDHSDFTEPLGSRVLRFLVSEDLVKQRVVRLLKQADELWWQWVLKHRDQEKMSGWIGGGSEHNLKVVSYSTHLVFLHHPLYLVVDFASVMGHSEVWLLAELVPADVGIITELLLQTNPECLRV